MTFLLAQWSTSFVVAIIVGLLLAAGLATAKVRRDLASLSARVPTHFEAWHEETAGTRSVPIERVCRSRCMRFSVNQSRDSRTALALVGSAR